MKTFYEKFKDKIDRTDNSVVLFEGEYKEIQLDAYEKGIRDAAEAACDSQKYYTRDASVQCLQIHDRILALLTKPKDKE